MRSPVLIAAALSALLVALAGAGALHGRSDGGDGDGPSKAGPTAVGRQLIPAKTSSASDDLVPEGYPDSRTTGVPAGTLLRPHQGDIAVRDDGAVLDRLDINGCVTVRADNVVIKRSRITCAGQPGVWPIRVYTGFSGTKVTDVEIDGAGVASVAVLGDGYTLTRVNVHNSTDGPRLGAGSSIIGSYVHDLARRPKTHNDTLQTIGGSDILVRGNTLLAYKPSTDDPMNGAIQTGRLHSRLDRMLVEDNYLDGGSYTVRGGSGPRDAASIGLYVFRNNAFGHNCGFGPVNGVDPPVTWEPTNHWIDTPDQPLTTDSKANKRGCRKTARARVQHDEKAAPASPPPAPGAAL
jgi:hypothetical protein